MSAARTLVTTALIAFLALATAAHGTPPPPQLIANGDFENATLSPWVGYNGAPALVGQATWAPAGGKQSVDLSNYGGIAQNVPTTPGGRYDLSFAYAGNPGCTQGVKHLTVAWNGNLTGNGAGSARFTFDTTGHSTASMGWQTAHVLVDAAFDYTWLTLGDLVDADCGIAIDKVGMIAASGTQTGTQLTGPNQSTVLGDSLTVTATVLGASSAVTPTGTVQFEIDGVPAGAPVALTSGQAQKTFDGLARGDYEMSALYTPDSPSFAASSVTEPYSVVRDSSTTTLAVDSSPAPLGQEVTLTARVAVVAPGSAPLSGTVQFSDEFGALGDPVPIGPDGVAQIGVGEDVGSHTLYASYGGTDDILSSYDYGYLDVFDPNPPPPAPGSLVATTTTLVSSKNPIPAGESFTVTATVAPSTPDSAPLDGTVQFSVGGVPVGPPVALDGGHSATSGALQIPAGVTRATVRAGYSGNSHFASSSGLLTERSAVTITRPPPAPTTSGPPPPDTTPPIFTLDLTPVRLKAALGKGIKAHAGCSENCSVVVEFALTARRARALGMKTRGTRVVVGRASYDFADRTASDLVVKLTRRFRKALGKANRVLLRMTATATDLSGNDAVLTRNVTLKR